MICKGGALKILVKTQRETSAQKSTFNKVKARTLLKKGLQHLCFAVNFVKFAEDYCFCVGCDLGNILLLKVCFF